MSTPLRVAILDDHLPILDGYRYRLEKVPDIAVVATASWGAELEPLLEAEPVDVLLLDLQVPTAPDNGNPYPVLEILPRILARYPSLCVLIISMYIKPVFVKAVMRAGASGYILKDDRETLRQLAEIIRRVAAGEIYLSDQAREQLELSDADPQLTSRQLEILSLCASEPDATTEEIGGRLSIAPSTVRNTLSDAYFRLDVRNRSGAILKLQELGLLPPLAPEPPQL